MQYLGHGIHSDKTLKQKKQEKYYKKRKEILSSNFLRIFKLFQNN